SKKLTLFITHGHEDHIGAIHHLILAFPEMEIFAPRFAEILIKNKLAPRKINKKIHLYTHKDKLKFDEYTLHPIHVTHSIPDTHGFVFHSSEFSTLFISDFKFDLNPSFENPFDLLKIKKLLATSKKSLAMLDSTNILSAGKTLSESDLIPDLEKIISNEKRTFITLFSSNIYRVKNILELSKKHKKKVVTIGRSIQNYLNAAYAAKIIDENTYPVVDLDSVQNHADTKIIYVITGSQGEHLGAARRIISGEQKNIQLNSSDQFVFCSKPIPGNEAKIYRLYNMLAQTGVDLITSKDMQIHASGHPCQQDLHSVLSEIKPNFFIPIHGETYFLRKHIQFVKGNYPNIETILLQNFQGVEYKNSKLKEFSLQEKLPSIIHGKDLPIERERISERRKLAISGAVFISLNHKSQNIKIDLKGLPIEMDQHIPKMRDLVDYCAFSENKKRDHDYTIEQVRIKIRTFCNSLLGYKPITLVQMV
ncbi:MAG: ribonuclease J, partial [Halobacteriovoraceae bacterium]|nr:ribonuclease J [Halobacteriovoraceae bacterium]